MYLDGGEFPTDYCRAAYQECSKIKVCDPAVRIPKEAKRHPIEAITTHESDFPLPDEYMAPAGGESP